MSRSNRSRGSRLVDFRLTPGRLPLTLAKEMKNSYFRRLPIFGALVAGLAAWLFYPHLLNLITAPIQQSVQPMPRMPSEVFIHRLQTASAFSVLGFLIPLAAILTSRGRATGIFERRLALFAVLSFMIAISTSWFMIARLKSIAVFIADLESQNPDIPSVVDYSMFSLYRIAAYPLLLLLVVIAFTLVRSNRSKEKIAKPKDSIRVER